MEIMKPFDVTDTTLTSTSIAEPDIASGEVEWSSNLNGGRTDITPTIYGYTAIASNGDTDYIVERKGGSSVLKEYLNGVKQGLDVTITTVTAFQSDAHYYNDNLYIADQSRVVFYNTLTLSQGVLSIVGGLDGSDTFASICSVGSNFYLYDSFNKKIKVYALSGTTLNYSGNSFNIDFSYEYPKITPSDGGGFIVLTAGKVTLYSQLFSLIKEYQLPDLNPQIIGRDGISNNGVGYKTLSSDGANIKGYSYDFAYLGDYNAGDEVIKTSTHRVYKAATTTDDDPEVGVTLIPPTWVDQQYTNKYRMFNDAKDSKSTAASDIVTEYDFNKSVTTVATLGVIGTSVMVTVTDPVDGVVYEVEKETADAGVNDFWAFWFEPYTFREDLVFDNMPPGYPETTVKVEVKATSGERAVGRVLSGLPVNIGVTNEPTTVGRQNFTLRTRDGFGNLTITPKRSIKVLNYDVAVNKNDLDSTDRILESVGKIPALYIGEGDLESMICFGMAEDYRMDHNSAFSNMRLEVKEI